MITYYSPVPPKMTSGFHLDSLQNYPNLCPQKVVSAAFKWSNQRKNNPPKCKPKRPFFPARWPWTLNQKISPRPAFGRSRRGSFGSTGLSVQWPWGKKGHLFWGLGLQIFRAGGQKTRGKRMGAATKTKGEK